MENNLKSRFIEKALKTHGNRYDYSSAQYVNGVTKIDIRCPEHGFFTQKPASHVVGKGCPVCGNLKRSKSNTCTTEKFIEKALKIHGNRYDYSKVSYVDISTKVIIGCPKHGDFLQTPKGHLKGRICKKCAMEDLRESTKITSSDFVDKAVAIHGSKYDYTGVKYVNAHSKVEINCSKHGAFLQIANDHLCGYGCPVCGYEMVAEKRTLTQEEFIHKAKAVHNDKGYGYEKAIYVNALSDVIVTCPIHGDFRQNAHSFLQGHGCQACQTSRGELKISEWLKANDIKFIRQYQIKELRNKRNLRFDFYIPELNQLIEYDGEQHFKPTHINGVSIDKAIEIHKGTQYRDNLKNKFCEQKGIPLMRIPYYEFDKIDTILESKLMGLKECIYGK